MREIPGREQLTAYPVCVPHAEVLDRYFRLFPERIRSEVLRYEAAHLVKEAERLVGESQDLRSDHWDDRPDYGD